MAQLVARLAWDEEVAGSSPATLTIGEMPERLNGARLKRDGPIGAPEFESLSLRQFTRFRSTDRTRRYERRDGGSIPSGEARYGRLTEWFKAPAC